MGILSKLKNLFKKNLNEDLREDLEDLLIEADIPYPQVKLIINNINFKQNLNQEILRDNLKNSLLPLLREEEFLIEKDKLNVFLIVGVNGVGKTSLIAKLANHLKRDKMNKILLIGADTFRAAAIEQLRAYSEKLKLRFISQMQNSDPAAVIFDGIESAKKKGENIVLIDTAGRLSNKEHLIRELEKLNKVILKQLANTSYNYKKILVIDSTTGKNAESQIEIFHKAIEIDGIVITKFDSSSRAGIIFTIERKYKKPIYFITNGENISDIRDFSKELFLNKLID